MNGFRFSRRFALLTTVPILALTIVVGSAQAQQKELMAFFHNLIGLENKEINRIKQGKVVSKLIDTQEKSELIVFGAVYVRASMDSYVELFKDLHRLERYENYLAVRRFSEPPQLSDLDDLELDAEDIKDLQKCKIGDCEIQLPANRMETFLQQVDWQADNVPLQVNNLAKQMILEGLQAYLRGGNRAFGAYRDKKRPQDVAENFKRLLGRLDVLPDYVPELNNFLLNYPEAHLADAEDYLYWEKVKFGLKPTIRLNHVVIYPIRSDHLSAYTTAIKQLYANHYFHTAIDLSFCVKPDPEELGFFLITIKGSSQDGLTGLKGSFVRRIVRGRTRDSLEGALAAIKNELEATNTASP